MGVVRCPCSLAFEAIAGNFSKQVRFCNVDDVRATDRSAASQTSPCGGNTSATSGKQQATISLEMKNATVLAERLIFRAEQHRTTHANVRLDGMEIQRPLLPIPPPA